MKREMKKKLHRAMAVLLTVILISVNLNVAAIAEESDGDTTLEEEVYVIRPREGLSKYYGQSLNLFAGEHYDITLSGNDTSLSEDAIPGEWRICLESEEVGDQKFKIICSVSENAVLAEDAPTFKIRNDYHVTPGVEAEIEENSSDENKVVLTAPAGYLISKKCKTDSYTRGGTMSENNANTPSAESDAGWYTSLEYDVEDQEDGLVLKYYLRSNMDNDTKGAIDCTPRTKTVNKGATKPVITVQYEVQGTTANVSLASSKPGIYYYVAGEESLDLDAEAIMENAEKPENMSGSGRIADNVSITLTDLAPGTTYYLQFVVKDGGGNVSEVKRIEVTTDGDDGDDDIPSNPGGDDITTDKYEIIPFGGLSKYYGQNKRLLEGEHYSIAVSGNDVVTADKKMGDWSISLESEEPGEQKFVVSGNTVSLTENAPTFKILEYHVPAGIAEDVTIDKKIVNQSGAPDYTVTLTAPDEYLISDGSGTDSYTWGGSGTYSGNGAAETGEHEWGNSMEISIKDAKDGVVVISYYLRSNCNDSTKGAIDRTKRTIVVHKDTIKPQIKSLAAASLGGDAADVDLIGSEAGTYYYMVTVTATAEPPTAEVIQNNAKLGMGRTGSGRVVGNPAGDASATINITNLAASTHYYLYAVVVDDFGNVSEVKDTNFITGLPAIEGEVQISGAVEVGSTLTANVDLKYTDVNPLTYQWYRLSLDEDKDALNQVYDETDDSDEDENNEGNDSNAAYDAESSIDDEIETPAWSIDGGDAVPVKGATSRTYQITKEDIGYRLVVSVREAEDPYVVNSYSGELIGSTATFVPKLIPAYTLPTVKSIVYSPTNKLSDIALPAGWSWVDGSITPEYGNSGYRAQFVPADTRIYRTTVVNINVPVTKRKLKKSWVRIAANTAYAGEKIKDNFKVVYQKYHLVSGEDYKATYSKNKKLGKATVKIRGIGNYKGSVTVTYNIVQKSIGKVSCKYDAAMVYTGKEVTLSLTMKNNSEKLKKGRDYTVTYKNNVEIGKATATIKGIGNYKGTKKITFSIVPAKPKLTVRKKGSGFSAKMTSVDEISGYQLEVSTSRSFAKTKTQTYRVTGTGFELPALTKGKYYVRVMSYVTKGKKEYTSAYSSIKKITIK